MTAFKFVKEQKRSETDMLLFFWEIFLDCEKSRDL